MTYMYNVIYNIVIDFKTICKVQTVQKRTWEENDKLKFHISDEINGNLFLLEESALERTAARPEISRN